MPSACRGGEQLFLLGAGKGGKTTGRQARKQATDEENKGAVE